MKVEKRHSEILGIVAADGEVSVSGLSELFSVSEVTIRADLKQLDSAGLIHRTRGGALSRNRLHPELTIAEKASKNVPVKQAIAVKASELIREGDAVILDSGTTTAEIARCLSAFDQLTVMTNGLNIAEILLSANGVDVMMTGGTIRKKSQSFFGKHAEASLSQYQFDRVILGVDGFDLTKGITTHFEYEAALNKKMCESSKEIIVATDSSKFNRSSLHKICDYDQIDILVTDPGIPDSIAAALEAKDIRLIIV